MKFLCVSLKDPYFLRYVITKMKFDICFLLFMTNFFHDKGEIDHFSTFNSSSSLKFFRPILSRQLGANVIYNFT